MPRNRHSLDSIHTKLQEAEKTLNLLTAWKAADPDVFYISLAHDKVPTTWKQANIIPIFPKSDPLKLSRYYFPVMIHCITVLPAKSDSDVMFVYIIIRDF